MKKALTWRWPPTLIRTALVMGQVLYLPGCVSPGPEPKASGSESEPEGDIPWAAGEEPADAESTTRQVSAGPKPQEEITDHYEEDGIAESTPGPVCTGKATPAMRAAVAARVQETSSCNDRIPAEKAGAKGDLKVNLKVGKDGAVMSLSVLADTLSVPEVTSCIEEVLRRPFGDTKPRGGCAVFVMPIHFESERIEEAPSSDASESEASESDD